MFSGVTSTFIGVVRSQLQPNYTQLTYDLLAIIADHKGLEVPTKPKSDSPWTGPNPVLVHIQYILFSSLAASLLAALVAILGKQWLDRYSEVDVRGSLIERSRDRQRKIDGMSSWRFKFIMESLPLMLQAALLLLGYALSNCLYTIDKAVAAAINGFTAAGLLFYGAFYNYPFRTLISLIVRLIIRLVGGHLEGCVGWFRRVFSQVKKWLRPNHSQNLNTVDGWDHTKLVRAGLFNDSPVLLGGGADWDSYVLDANCIAWMFEVSTDADVTLDIIKFIPEIVWHPGIRTTPLERLYDTVVECFDFSSDRPVVIPKLREKAYLSAKALVHIAVQRKCMDKTSDEEAFMSIPSRPKIIGYEGDPDLESTLEMVEGIFGTRDPGKIPWQSFSFTDPHRAWIGRILLYRAYESLKEDDPLPDDIKEFILHSLQARRPPPASVVTSCLLMVGLLLEVKLKFDKQPVTDKRLVDFARVRP